MFTKLHFPQSLLFIFFLTPLAHAFINITPPVIAEKEGTSLEVSVGAKYNRGNTDNNEVSLFVKSQYDEKEWLLYLLSSYTYGESKNIKETDNGSLHLRYIHTIEESAYEYEMFAQTEFNQFQKIKERHLLGGNIRRKIDFAFEKFYLGVGGFYASVSPDKVTSFDLKYETVNFNFYLSFKEQIKSNISLSYIGFYQPNVETFSDYRLYQTLQLQTALSQNLTLSLRLNYEYNNKPYQGIEPSDVRSVLNLGYTFN